VNRPGRVYSFDFRIRGAVFTHDLTGRKLRMPTDAPVQIPSFIVAGYIQTKPVLYLQGQRGPRIREVVIRARQDLRHSRLVFPSGFKHELNTGLHTPRRFLHPMIYHVNADSVDFIRRIRLRYSQRFHKQNYFAAYRPGITKPPAEKVFRTQRHRNPKTSEKKKRKEKAEKKD